VLRCKGQMSARATAEQFNVTVAQVKTAWTRGTPKSTLPKWRCCCGRVTNETHCAIGHPAPWHVADEHQAAMLRSLAAEPWTDEEAA
jgi:hypothetical protein